MPTITNITDITEGASPRRRWVARFADLVAEGDSAAEALSRLAVLIRCHASEVDAMARREAGAVCPESPWSW